MMGASKNVRGPRWLVALALAGGCSKGEGEPASDPAPLLTRAELLDPAQCKSCHPTHYREWASSMHAYASADPVFLAMNRRGQRETEGALGDFCVRCHAPMAVFDGLTSDGLNIEQLPKEYQGVTCYFCHNTIAVGQHFNNDLTLANDQIMRGGLSDPREAGAHLSAYSAFHDRNSERSAELCGSCHDVVTPNGVELERTFQEYKASLFATKGPGFDTCSGCHMPGRPGQVATGGPERVVHEHLWPGVDIALTPFPDAEAQRIAVECALSLDARIFSFTADPIGGITIQVESSAGHGQPSGTAQDRRLWLEVVAYDDADQVVFQSGRIEDGELEDKAPGDPGYDRHLTLYRDWLYGADGQPVHMFWEAAPSADYPEGFTSLTLPAPARLNEPHALEARYEIPNFDQVARITVRLRMRPMGLDVLQSLVDSGDLDPSHLARVPTFTLHGASAEWSKADGKLRSLWPEDLRCPDDYREALEDPP